MSRMMKVPSCASRVPAACVYRAFSDKVCTQLSALLYKQPLAPVIQSKLPFYCTSYCTYDVSFYWQSPPISGSCIDIGLHGNSPHVDTPFELACVCTSTDLGCDSGDWYSDDLHCHSPSPERAGSHTRSGRNDSDRRFWSLLVRFPCRMSSILATT